jgi:3-hydroxybutyryl-CoA dehydrogenase
MVMKPIQTVAVLGAGTMGQGIARVCAAAGFKTFLFDISDALVRNGINILEKGLAADIEKGKLTEARRSEILKNIIPCHERQELSADLVIEAVVENLEVKQNLFREMEKIMDARRPGQGETVWVTNTSSLSVTQIASALHHPERCIGLHFFNPVPLMKLVEVIGGAATGQECVEEMVEFSKKLGKIPVVVKDSPGFIVNRVARHYYVESLKLLEENTSDVRGIDALLRSAGFKMGPFELMDFIGIDTNYSVTTSLFHSFHQAVKFKPSRLQKEKIDAGQLGRKTGKGFYDYEKN